MSEKEINKTQQDKDGWIDRALRNENETYKQR